MDPSSSGVTTRSIFGGRSSTRTTRSKRSREGVSDDTKTPSSGDYTSTTMDPSSSGVTTRSVFGGRSITHTTRSKSREGSSDDTNAANPGSPRMKLPSPAVIKELKSLYCCNIPVTLMNRDLLRKHFESFGPVVHFYMSVKRNSCTIHFETHGAAESAKANGDKLNGFPLHIFWSQPASTKTMKGKSICESLPAQKTETPVEWPVTTRRESHEKKRTRLSQQLQMSAVDKAKTRVRKRLKSEELKKAKVTTKIYDLPDEVKDELKAMAEGQEYRPLREQQKAKAEKDSKSIAEKSTEDKALVGIYKSSKTKSPMHRALEPSPLRQGSPARGLGMKTVRSSVPSTSSASPSLPTTSGEDLLPELLELWNLKSKLQFHRPEDRCHILDLRDKILRIKKGKQSDLSKAELFKGTCPDMCPEKERYLRESRQQLSLYEYPGFGSKEILLDHSLAIKQYSRSSADQDEPLPHELRPPHVLRMTMDYLLAYIMDRCDLKNENLREWYHFLWDRTRGIRKDITHQELCDMDAVSLIEECVRFHIHCSERFVAEKSSVFDSKINSENLTKCLQTLKYMYHDMALKGIICPNEAEFRGYIILLNLGDSNFLWELKDLRPEIIKSEPVQFGVQVFHKLNNNNYVGFFNLVKMTTYLNACMLLRYFYQVRSKALQIIVKSHCPVTKQTVLSLGELVRLLCFEDAREAAVFCDHHGLRLEESNSEVMILKENLSLPTHALPMARAVKLIESKRLKSVGETIKRGPLNMTSFENHKPYTSFNANGTIKEGALFTEQEQKSMTEPQPQIEKSGEELKRLEVEAARIRQELEMAEQARSQEMIQEMLSEIIQEEIGVFRERLENVAILDLDEMLLDVLCNMTREVFKEVVTEEEEKKRKREEELHRQKEEEDRRREMMEAAAKECAAKVLEETTCQMISEVTAAEVTHHNIALECMEEILEEEVNDEARALVEDEVMKCKLDYMRLRRKDYYRKKYFNLWRTMVKKQKEKRRAMEDFPAWSSRLTLAQQASLLAKPPEILPLRREPIKCEPSPDLPADEMFEIRFFDLVAGHLCVMRSCPSSFWKFYKLVVSLPDAEESPLYSEFLEKFINIAFPETEGLAMEDPPRLLQRMTVNREYVLAVSMRCVIGPMILSKPDTLRGMNGLLFVVTHDSPSVELTRMRLCELISARKYYGGIALAIILTKDRPLDQVEEMLQINSLKQLTSQNVNVQYFVRHKGPSGLINAFVLAIYWLASQHLLFSTPYFIRVSFLVETYLQIRLWERFQRAEGLPEDDVNKLKLDLGLVIRIHNRACKDLLYTVTDEEVTSCSIGAPEFAPFIPKCSDEDMFRYRVMPLYYGSPEYKEKLIQIFKAAEFVLPAIPYPKNKEEFEDYLLEVCTYNAVSREGCCQVLDFFANCTQGVEADPNSEEWVDEAVNCFSWILMFKLMNQWRLLEIDMTDTLHGGSAQQPIIVAVQPHRLNRFLMDQWNYMLGDPDFFNEAREIPRRQCRLKSSGKSEPPVPGSKRKLFEETYNMTLEEVIAKYTQPALESLDKTFKRCEELKNCKAVLDDLSKSIAESEARQTELTRCLEEAIETCHV